MFRFSFMTSATFAKTLQHLISVVIMLNSTKLIATSHSREIWAKILFHLNVRLLDANAIVQHVYVILLLASWLTTAWDQLSVFLISVDSSFLLLMFIFSSRALSRVIFANIFVLILNDSIDIILLLTAAIVLSHLTCLFVFSICFIMCSILLEKSNPA